MDKEFKIDLVKTFDTGHELEELYPPLMLLLSNVYYEEDTSNLIKELGNQVKKLPIGSKIEMIFKRKGNGIKNDGNSQEKTKSVDTPKLIHNMDSQIIGEIQFKIPFRFTFVYDDNRRSVFENIIRFVAMKTGCYALFDDKERCFVVRPLYEYVIEEPMPNISS